MSLLRRTMKNMPAPRRARAANPPTAPPTIAAVGVLDEPVGTGEADELEAVGWISPIVLLLLLLGVFTVLAAALKVKVELVGFDGVLDFAPELVKVKTSGLKVRSSFSPR